MVRLLSAVWPIIYISSILSISARVNSIELSDIFDLIHISKFVVHHIGYSCNVVDENFFENVPHLAHTCNGKKLFKRLKTINDNIVSLKTQINGIETLTKLIKDMPDHVHYEFKLNELWSYIKDVDIMYEKMQLYVEDKSAYENYTLEEFAKSVVSHRSNSVDILVDKIHKALLGNSSLDGKGILELQAFKQSTIDKNILCSLNVSPQRFLLNLYHIIALAELKGYLMIQFSYKLLKLYNKGNFTKESHLARKEYEANRRESLNEIINIASRSSRELWICDPKVHQPDITYLEITELLQGYIQNEIDMNPDGGCWENCASYDNTKNYGCYENLFCKQQRKCRGTIMNCTFIDSKSIICPTRNARHRRYEFIQYNNGKKFGTANKCSESKINVDSWWKYLAWQCSYCACLCDDSGSNSDRYINMLPSLSNIENNMVVTGLRFTKYNRIIHLQIQEGKLLPDENIDQETVAWVPVHLYNITDPHYKIEQDFHMLSWKDRALDLHDIQKNVTLNEVVTGIRFRKIGYHLNLEVQFTQYDITTGRLLNKTEWRGNYNTEYTIDNPRELLSMEKLDVPTKSPSSSRPDSKSNQFIMFTHSDWEADVAQTTVPFLDAQAVTHRPAVPLSGVGLYHKGHKGFGGFVAPRIFTFDIVENLKRILNKSNI